MVDKRDAIIKEHMGTITKAVSMYADGGTDKWDDLFSASMMGAAMALETWDEEGNANLNTYLTTCCHNAIRNELRRLNKWDKEIAESRMGTDTEEEEMSYSDTVTAHADGINPLWVEDEYNPEELYLQREDVEAANQLVADLVNHLNDRENYVLWNHIISDDPIPMREIATQFNCSKDSVLRDVKRIKDMLKMEEV